MTYFKVEMPDGSVELRSEGWGASLGECGSW